MNYLCKMQWITVNMVVKYLQFPTHQIPDVLHRDKMIPEMVQDLPLLQDLEQGPDKVIHFLIRVGDYRVGASGSWLAQITKHT